MGKDYQYLLGRLKEVNSSFELTKSLGFELDERTKELTIVVKKNCLSSNMQNDSAAFESWAIILKHYLSSEINSVVIDWEMDFSDGDDGLLHYNRFVYRLTKFVQTYDWVRTARPIPELPSILFCNAPNQPAANISEHKPGSEGWLECKYVQDHQSEFDVMDHQFPVGLFHHKVSKSTHFTTGQKSAIDIWSIQDDVLSIFELKLADNKPLGIISELMFYTNVIDDILCHQIMYENSSSVRRAAKESFRSFGKFYQAYLNGNVKGIQAILLADSLHPMITAELISFINSSPRLRYKNIHYECRRVSL